MNQKNITRMFLFIIFMVLFIGVVSAVEVSNDTVNTDTVGTISTVSDTVDIDKSVSNRNMKGHLKLSSKTYDVNDFDTLHNVLTNNSYDTVNINIKSDITLKNNTNVNDAIKTLNIEGNGKTINGNNTYQFLKITSGTTTINNIKIVNCFGQFGGAIYSNATLIITNSTLNNNTANLDDYNRGYGGSIYNYEGDLRIVNSSFNNNTARQGGAISSYHGNLTITLSYFKNNTINLTKQAVSDEFVGGDMIFIEKGNFIAKNNSFVNNLDDSMGTIKLVSVKTQSINNVFGHDIISINSMNIINGKYVLTTKGIRENPVDGTYTKLDDGRVSYTLDGKWIGSINILNEKSWIVFDMPSIGNHTIVATYIDSNGKTKSSDTFTFEKIADINLLFNQYSVKNSTATLVNYVKDDQGNNVNDGRISYTVNGKWIGSTGVKNGSSMIKFNYTYQKALLKATYITNSNITHNIYTKTLDLPEFPELKEYKSQVIINSMNVINDKYVLTTKISNEYTKLNYGRVSYTLDGKWIGSIDILNEKSWIVFDMPSIGNHTIVATYTDSYGNTISTDTFTFEKIADVNLLFNQISVKNGTATLVNYVKDDQGNNINDGRISYSLNGKWIGSTSIKNGSSIIKFNYTNSTVKFQATYITNSGVTQNIYTRTLNLDEISKLKQA